MRREETMNRIVSEKFLKLVSENPDAPIRVYISGECYAEDGCWYIGEVTNCDLTEITEYEMLGCDVRYFEKYDIDEIIEDIEERLSDEEKYAKMSDEELDKIAKQKAEELPWEQVILLYVGV